MITCLAHLNRYGLKRVRGRFGNILYGIIGREDDDNGPREAGDAICTRDHLHLSLLLRVSVGPHFSRWAHSFAKRIPKKTFNLGEWCSLLDLRKIFLGQFIRSVFNVHCGGAAG